MSYSVDKTAQLAEAQKRGRFGQKASLQAQGVQTRQHNVESEEAPEEKSDETAKSTKQSAKPAKRKS